MQEDPSTVDAIDNMTDHAGAINKDTGWANCQYLEQGQGQGRGQGQEQGWEQGQECKILCYAVYHTFSVRKYIHFFVIPTYFLVRQPSIQESRGQSLTCRFVPVT